MLNSYSIPLRTLVPATEIRLGTIETTVGIAKTDTMDAVAANSRDRYRDRHSRYRERSPDRGRRDRPYDDRVRGLDGYDRRRYRSRSREYRKDDRNGRTRLPDRDLDTYRPGGHRPDRDERPRDGEAGRDRSSPDRGSRPKSSSPEPRLTEDERDKRTVFVQQLSQRLRSKQLVAFFEQAGPVKEAQIVKDRVSGRSKG